MMDDIDYRRIESTHRRRVRELETLMKELETQRDNALEAARVQRAWAEDYKIQRDKLLGALDLIACWDEGSEVTGGFDDPASAIIARRAIASVHDPYDRLEES